MSNQTLSASQRKMYLCPTEFIDVNHPTIQTMAHELISQIPLENETEKAIALFYFVRDKIKYRVEKNRKYYSRFQLKASETLKRGAGYCIQKAVLFAALARAVGIPARIHFVDIINYLSPRKFIEEIGSDMFIYHGILQLYLNDQWLDANVAFDKDLCLRKGYPIGEFDGKSSCLFSHIDDQGRKFVEYIKDRGIYANVPHSWRL